MSDHPKPAAPALGGQGRVQGDRKGASLQGAIFRKVNIEQTERWDSSFNQEALIRYYHSPKL